MQMLLSELIKKGTVSPEYKYIQDNDAIDVPQCLETLVKKCPEALVVEMGDSTLAIEVDGKLWAVQFKKPEQSARQLRHEVWGYLFLALGREKMYQEFLCHQLNTEI